MVRAFRFAAERSAPTATTWWFAPFGGCLAAGLLLVAGVPVTFSEFISYPLLRSGFEVLVCTIVAYLIMFLFWLAVYPIHQRFALQGGVRAVLRQRLGAQMGPFVLMGIGLFSFAIFTSVGLAWLTVQVMNGGTKFQGISSGRTDIAAGGPDFLLQVPEGRYRFKWDPMKQVRFDLKLDTERNPDMTNNPAFILHNKTNTIGYNITAVWKSETSGVQGLLETSPRFAGVKFDVKDTQILIFAPQGSTSPNYLYYLDDAPKQTVPVVAKDTEIYFPAQLWPLAAIYLIDKMPSKSGESTGPFIARVGVSWETAEGKKNRDFRIRITATNTKATDSESPTIDSVLNFNIEELGQ